METTTRKMMEIKLSDLQSQLNKQQQDYQDIDQLKKLIENGGFLTWQN